MEVKKMKRVIAVILVLCMALSLCACSSSGSGSASGEKVIKIGVKDVFGHSGPAVDLLKEFGLCAENIVAVTKAALGK
jgi:transketolase